jgi:hypothetical protein
MGRGGGITSAASGAEAGVQAGSASAAGRLTGAVPQALNSTEPARIQAAQDALRHAAKAGKRISIFLTRMIP